MPSAIITQTDDIVVIKDIAPKAPIHYLIIPKKHIDTLQSFEPVDQPLAGNMFMMAQTLGKQLPNPQAFRVVINNGAAAGQQVFHVHMHFLAGSTISEF